jgi:hypothetical protein
MIRCVIVTVSTVPILVFGGVARVRIGASAVVVRVVGRVGVVVVFRSEAAKGEVQNRSIGAREEFLYVLRKSFRFVAGPHEFPVVGQVSISVQSVPLVNRCRAASS